VHTRRGTERVLRASELVVSELSVQTPDLDDVFLTLTGGQDAAKVASR